MKERLCHCNLHSTGLSSLLLLPRLQLPDRTSCRCVIPLDRQQSGLLCGVCRGGLDAAHLQHPQRCQVLACALVPVKV